MSGDPEPPRADFCATHAARIQDSGVVPVYFIARLFQHMWSTNPSLTTTPGCMLCKVSEEALVDCLRAAGELEARTMANAAGAGEAARHGSVES